MDGLDDVGRCYLGNGVWLGYTGQVEALRWEFASS